MTAKAQALYQELWKRAASGQNVELQLNDEAEVARVRFKLYNATKAARKGQGDPALQQAVADCQLLHTATTITISRLDKDPLLLKLAAQAGVRLEELGAPAPQTSEAMELEESQKKLLSTFAEVGRTAPPTKYFTRD